jgi:hypothetical protein
MFIGAAGSAPRYQIANSLRLRASASAYLSKTFSTNPTDNGKGTFSFFVKRGRLGTTTHGLLGASGGAGTGQFTFQSDDTLYFQSNQATPPAKQTTRVFRDPTAHLHIVYSWNTANTQNGSPKQQRLWISGVEETAFSTDQEPSRNLTGGNWFANGVTLSLLTQSANYFDGLCSDFYGIDGQDLTASSFGEFNLDGVWVPKAYSGTYGINGFHLDFKDAAVTSGSNAGLGKDTSGNGNYFNTTLISASTGTTCDGSVLDQMIDTPTNNFCTLNPIDLPGLTVADGNLRLVGVSTVNRAVRSTFMMETQKCYYEFICDEATYGMPGGALAEANIISGNIGLCQTGAWGLTSGGQCYKDGSVQRTVGTWTTDNVVGVFFDPVAGNAWFSVNGTVLNTGNPDAGTNPCITGLTGGKFFPAFNEAINGNTVRVSFGQQPIVTGATFSATSGGWFKYQPSAGNGATFKALCTANLPVVAITKPKAHFDIKTNTGDNATPKQIVTGLAFQPDLIWSKDRISAYTHTIYDSVRGVGSAKAISSALPDLEGFSSGTPAVYGYVSSIQTDGFTTTTGSTSNVYHNYTGETYVNWMWKAGGNANTFNKNGTGYASMAAAGITEGTLAATGISVNTTAGLSVVAFTGNGANNTVAHGLNALPAMIFVKDRDTSTGGVVYHNKLTSQSYYLPLFQTTNTGAETSDATVWQASGMTTNLFSVGASTSSNASTKKMIAYVFAEVAGFSKFGSYVGNASTDGTFVYLGFRPRFLLVRSTSSGSWYLYDTSRDTYNISKTYLIPGSSAAEATSSSDFDILSNGFKLRMGNASIGQAQTFVYAAFAEHPFGGSNCSPSPAR